MKHDHKKTKKLKIALFSIVMLLPCLAVGITCLTHVFNKEVAEDTQTATINYKYELGTENPPTKQSAINKLYKIEQINTTFDLYKIEYITDGTNTAINENAQESGYYFDNTGIYTNDFTFSYPVYIVITDIEETPQPYNYFLTPPQNNDYNLIESVTINTITQDHTTNIFYDSCEQVKDSFVLNWCDANNPISQPIISFTNVFSLPNDHIINTLLTYWFSISMIYIVIDIIIECIVYITHFFNKEQ